MSIQSEITRITNYRDLSFASVRNKGVTVPQNAVIEDLPDYIDAIQTGGGTSGDNLPYGFTDGTQPRAGIAQADLAVI